MDEEIEEGMFIEDESTPPPSDIQTGKASPYEILRDTKTSVEEAVAKMLSIKNHGQPKSQLRELVTQMFLHFVTLRQANRSILLEEDRVKAETERAKAPVDFTTLQLNNLMYEKSHYVKAIKACKDFKSKYPDIELVSEDDFFRDASEEIKNSVRSKDNAHNLMLQRLDYELYQRRELCKRREELELHKKGLLEVIANRKKFLSSLPSHLKSLKKASLPVQNQLGILQTKKLKQHQLAELLPPPLYVVYSQFLAQKEAFGENIDLEIVGSVKDAQSFARHQANKETGSGTSNNVESSKLEDDAPDEDDDGQRRRKRPKKIPGKMSHEHSGIYQVHPLKIILHIYDDGTSEHKPSKLLSLKFECLLKLNVVCVGTEGSHDGPENNILCNLFPDDTGLELPHQFAKLSVGDTLAFSEKRTSRPYKWAQHLAGIDFLPEVPPLVSGQVSSNGETSKGDVLSGLSSYRQQNRIQTVVQRLRSRKKAQLALVEQLDSLEKLKWPVLTCDDVPWASHKPTCYLQGWSLLGCAASQASSTMEKEKVQDPIDVDVVGKSSSSREEVDGAREDGELPALVSASSILNTVQLTSLKAPNLAHSKQLTLISKSITPQVNYSRMLSFNKHDEDYELMLDLDSDLDEPVHNESVADDAASSPYEITRKTWMDYGTKEYCLILTRNTDSRERNLKLQAQIKTSMEYPLRPPLFTLNLYTTNSEENHDENVDSEWFNELRAMEAEVNLHILKMLPYDQENYILSHQVCCLAMLFNYCIGEASLVSERRKSSSVIDVGLCKPVSGSLRARSFRGRDRRKMISWKHIECTPGFPC